MQQRARVTAPLGLGSRATIDLVVEQKVCTTIVVLARINLVRK